MAIACVADWVPACAGMTVCGAGIFTKLIRTPSTASDNALGFRDGRRELSHLCPETSGACPRVGCDIPKLRQGVRPGRGALNDRPHLPDALESGARASGKSPRTGCWRCHVFQIKPVDGIGRHPVPLSSLRRESVRGQRRARPKHLLLDTYKHIFIREAAPI